MILPDQIIKNLRFCSNAKVHFKYLSELDKNRFQGLGDVHTEAFIEHAMAFADGLEFQFQEEVQYIMFVMHFLGSYFYDDARYEPITTTLRARVTGKDERIQECYRVFSAFSRRFLGEDFSVFATALERYAECSEGILQADNPSQFSFDAFCKAYALDANMRSAFPINAMHDAAKVAATELGISNERGIAVCLSLSFWMGTGFHKDPLYPWVKDKAEAAGQGIDARCMAIHGYAHKRMRRQLNAVKG